MNFIKLTLLKGRAVSQGLNGYTRVAAMDDLREAGRLVVKRAGKQIALFNSEKGVYACNNRCPHEGYPLSEGSLADGCVLTCNWHNWKFDFESGETLVGGDVLRRYPVRVQDGSVWLDLADPPPEEVAARALKSLRASFDDMDYGRMAREIARLQRAGADPLDALRAAIGWTHDRLEFGMTHAHPAGADWLALSEIVAQDAASALVPVVEAVAHQAWDSLREEQYPFPRAVADWNSARFVDAVEREDEPTAVAMVRGAVASGATFADLEEALAEAALAHYAGFGHAAIYVHKARELADRLGSAVLEPLLLVLVRGIIYARREDLIPEFRSYGPALAAWDCTGTRAPRPSDFVGLGVRAAIQKTLESSAHPQLLHGALLGAGAFNMLHFDADRQMRTDQSVSQNVGWLDFTHAITFGNAVGVLCSRYPGLWPQGLLQMACFAGRNAAYVDADQRVDAWTVDDPADFFETELGALIDHGELEYILACHRLKTTMAVRDELLRRPDADYNDVLLAALNRYLHSAFKRKHVLRTAKQSLAFVAAEG